MSSHHQDQEQQLLPLLPQLRSQDTVLDADTLNLLSMLHLTSSTNTTTTLPSKKRRSPSSSSSRSKKLRARRTALFPPPPPPPSPIPPPLSPLQRSNSEPINVNEPNPQLFGSLAAASSQLLKNVLSPETSNNSGFVSSPAANPSLPPLPPPLRRTSSAPIPSPARTCSRSPSCDRESPSSTRLKKIKEKMLEISEWCEAVVKENDEESTASEDGDRGKVHDEFDDQNENEEAVMVDEGVNGGLVLHFKCPCGKGYEVLLSGDSCYYKLL